MAKHVDLSEYCDPTMELDTPVRHDWCPFCGKLIKSAGFIVWRTTTGFKLYCHRCNTAKTISRPGVASPSTIISRVNASRTHGSRPGKVIYLPEDFEAFIPGFAKKWLHKYGVTDEEVTRYGFGFSPRMNRLIMPVFKDEQLVFWQGRGFNLDKHTPKYISMKCSGTGGAFFELVKPNFKEVVLVEDIVSAICCARAGYSSISLLGSFVGDKIASRLHELEITKVCIWLDPDKRKEAVKYSRKLSSLGFSCTCLVTPTKDPKDYNVTQIRNHLGKGGFEHDDGTQEVSALRA